MKTHMKLCAVRARAAGVAVLALPFVAAAPLSPSPALAQSASTAVQLSDATPAYGQAVAVRGQAAPAEAGRPVALEYAGADGAWQTLKTATVGAGGRYSFTVKLTHSGSLRASVGGAGNQGVQAVAAESDATRTAPRTVAVAAHLRVVSSRLIVMGSGTASLTGQLAPNGAGRLVRLERRVGRRWRAIASARTSPSGGFQLRHRVRGTGSSDVRLSFAGDAANRAAVRALGPMGAYRATLASYYTLYGGALACGGRLGYDSLVVAHRSLPCGTRVTVHYRGRTVQARVMDRGPFVGNREFDLAGAVARKLGFSGVDTVWVSV